MDNFQIETAQNVSIRQNVAGIGHRLLAYLVDMLIITAYWIVSFFVLAAFGIEGRAQGSVTIFFMIMGIPTFLYFLLFEMLWDGRTPGKASMHLRVVKLDGAKPGLGSFFVRWIMRIIDITLTSGGVAVFTILINGKGQRLGDMAAGTTVISEKQKTNLGQTLLVDIPKDYVPIYPQVTVFTDADMQTIKTVYTDARRYGNHRVIVKLSDKVSKTMQVTPQEKPMAFVGRVLQDYNFYTQQ